MNSKTVTRALLPEFSLKANAYGWDGQFPGASVRAFDREITIDIATRLVPRDDETPAVSQSQANLAKSICSWLPNLVATIESQMEDYHADYDPTGHWRDVIEPPRVWLDVERDDGASWTVVIERSDWPDFGYHLEFNNDQFQELWAGD